MSLLVFVDGYEGEYTRVFLWLSCARTFEQSLFSRSHQYGTCRSSCTWLGKRRLFFPLLVLIWVISQFAMVYGQLWFVEAGVVLRSIQINFPCKGECSFPFVSLFIACAVLLLVQFLGYSFFGNILNRLVSSWFLCPSMLHWILALMNMTRMRDCSWLLWWFLWEFNIWSVCSFAIYVFLQCVVGVSFNQHLQKWHLSDFIVKMTSLNGKLIISHVRSIFGRLMLMKMSSTYLIQNAGCIQGLHGHFSEKFRYGRVYNSICSYTSRLNLKHMHRRIPSSSWIVCYYRNSLIIFRGKSKSSELNGTVTSNVTIASSSCTVESFPRTDRGWSRSRLIHLSVAPHVSTVLYLTCILEFHERRQRVLVESVLCESLATLEVAVPIYQHSLVTLC